MKIDLGENLFAAVILLGFSFLVLFSAYGYAQVETPLVQAQAFFSQGQYDEAVKILDNYIEEIMAQPEQKPNLAAALYLLAKVYYEVGDDAKCDEALLNVFSVLPGFDRDESNYEFKERLTKAKAQLAGNLPARAENVKQATVKESAAGLDAMNWKKIANAWTAFVDNPTPATTNNLFFLIPVAPLGKDLVLDSEATAVLGNIINEINALESQILFESNRIAVKIAFHFYNFSQLELMLKVNGILGNFININVRMFLEELNSNRLLVPDLKGILASYRFDIVDAPSQLEIIKKIRVKAFKSINDKELNAIKNECLKIMENL